MDTVLEYLGILRTGGYQFRILGGIERQTDFATIQRTILDIRSWIATLKRVALKSKRTQTAARQGAFSHARASKLRLARIVLLNLFSSCEASTTESRVTELLRIDTIRHGIVIITAVILLKSAFATVIIIGPRGCRAPASFVPT
jgi:hypothetical protein